MKKVLSGVVVALALAACSGQTQPATNVTATSATLNATVSCSGGVPNPCYFEFAIDTVPIAQAGLHGNPYATGIDFSGPFMMTGSGNVSYTDTGLQPNTTYYYELCGSGDNVQQTTCVNEAAFVTP